MCDFRQRHLSGRSADGSGLAAPTLAFAEDAKPARFPTPEDTWNSIRDDIFKGRPILDGAGIVTLEAPHCARMPPSCQ